MSYKKIVCPGDTGIPYSFNMETRVLKISRCQESTSEYSGSKLELYSNAANSLSLQVPPSDSSRAFKKY